jgi:hypothetical protein
MNPRLPEDSSRPINPPGLIDRLLYNRPSHSLVAVMDVRLKKGQPAQRLYYRRLPAEAYRPVGVRHELESQQDAHCCEAAPYLVYNAIRFESQRDREGGFEANWVGIRRFNLETGLDEQVLDERTLCLGTPESSGWMSRIMGVSSDGSGAVCTVGLTTCGEGGYFVYEVSFAEGLKRMVTKLPRVFL